MSRIGIVTGMRAEADCASASAASLPKSLQPLLFISGANSARAYEGAWALVVQGAEALLSFGLSGGLDPALATGDIIVAASVMLPDGASIATDDAWRASLVNALGGRRASIGAIAGADRIVMTASAKAALRSRTGALAVDMESHKVAEAARAAGVPFMAIRVVLDPADRAVPWSACAGIAPNGSGRALPVLARLALKPWELPALLSLARANRRAVECLGGLAALLGPTFGFLV